LAGALSTTGHRVTSRTVALLLRQLGYSLRCPRGPSGHKEQVRRKAQFEYLGAQVEDFLRRGQPVIAVDGMKIEGAPSEGSAGRAPRTATAQEAADSRPVPPPEEEGTLALLASWENLGADRVLAEFAVECVWRWWRHVGRAGFPDAAGLLLAADLNGSLGREGSLRPLMQRLADAIGLPVQTSHHPPGTSKWTRTGYEMFCQLSSALPGQGAATYGVRVTLIGDRIAGEGPPDRSGGQDYLPGLSFPEGDQLPPEGGKERDEWNCTFVPRGSAAPPSPDRSGGEATGQGPDAGPPGKSS
jgi:hypothetical protein